MQSDWLRSGVQVGDPVTFELRDHVLEHELSLLETLQHDLVDGGIDCKLGDDAIQIPMLNTQIAKSFHASKCFGFDLIVH